MEIAFGLQLGIQKSLDWESWGCIGQMDLLQFFYNLPLVKIALWLRPKGVPQSLIAAILRHQVIVTVHIAMHSVSGRHVIG